MIAVAASNLLAVPKSPRRDARNVVFEVGSFRRSRCCRIFSTNKIIAQRRQPILNPGLATFELGNRKWKLFSAKTLKISD